MRRRLDIITMKFHLILTTSYGMLCYGMCSAVQYSTVQYSTVQYCTVQYCTVQYGTVQYSTVQYSTEQYSTVQYSTVQYSTVQYSTYHCYADPDLHPCYVGIFGFPCALEAAYACPYVIYSKDCEVERKDNDSDVTKR